ncbi:hypothetical protein AVEN_17983-1 [Araneus ventricosus]|uniref:Uncharacterized protein n=1 Tax=Araneus ventricosus TaxID=182803 RepID=A0A4Y2EIH0_ARAVE|nr:hypothetical protein AVEN_17983-1 [Araneus ventricosus]
MATYLKNIPETRSTGIAKRTALAQISNTNRQQITTNNSSSTFITARCLSAHPLAQQTKLQRDSKTFKRTPMVFTRLSTSEFLYLFRQDVTSYRILSKVFQNSVPSRDRTKILGYSRTSFCRQSRQVIK